MYGRKAESSWDPTRYDTLLSGMFFYTSDIYPVFGFIGTLRTSKSLFRGEWNLFYYDGRVVLYF